MMLTLWGIPVVVSDNVPTLKEGDLKLGKFRKGRSGGTDSEKDESGQATAMGHEGGDLGTHTQ